MLIDSPHAPIPAYCVPSSPNNFENPVKFPPPPSPFLYLLLFLTNRQDREKLGLGRVQQGSSQPVVTRRGLPPE